MSQAGQKSVGNLSLAHGQNLQSLRTHFDFNGLPWLKELQSAAWQTFCHRGFPTRREELWKYTDLSFLENLSFITAPQVDNIDLPEKLLPDVNRLVFINGYFQAELSELPPSITLLPLSRAWRECAEQIKPYLTEAAALSSWQSPALLNMAFAQEGIYLRMAAQTRLEKPLHLLFITTTTDEAPTLDQPRNIFIFDTQSQAAIVEEHWSTTQTTYYKNVVTTVQLNAGARLDYYKIQRESTTAFHTAAMHVVQHRHSQLNSYQISLGSRLARDDISVTLADGAGCQLRGLYLLAGNQHIDHHTRVDHYGVGASSEENYKGVLTDKAKGVFNGKIIVHPGAQKTRSVQTNKNILLTKTAEMNTKPELEIYADDVQCRHGATVGQLDPNALFYLRSRGIALDAAATLLTQAFVKEVLIPIPSRQIAEYIQIWVTEKLASYSMTPV